MESSGVSGRTSQHLSVGNNKQPDPTTNKVVKKGRFKISISSPFKWKAKKTVSISANKSLKAQSWSIKKAQPPLQVNTKPITLDALKRQRKMHYAYVQSSKAIISIHGADRFIARINAAKAQGNLTKPSADQLISMVNGIKKQLVTSTDSVKPNEGMTGQAQTITTLREAMDLKASMMKALAREQISSNESARLQIMLDHQLQVLATDKKQAKGMTLELLKSLTGYNDTKIKKIQSAIHKTLGYLPEKDNSINELQRRLNKLRDR